MAREQQQIVAEEPLRKRKSVRFGECPDPGSSGGPVGVVPSLVPHLPGLDPEPVKGRKQANRPSPSCGFVQQEDAREALLVRQRS